MKRKKTSSQLKKELYGIDVPLDIFDDNFAVIYGDKNKAIEYCESKGCVFDKGLTHEKADGFCIRNEIQSYVYIGKSLKDYNVIAHELMHAILNTTKIRGLYCGDNWGEQELECYLVGYVFGYVLNTKPKKWFIWRKGKWVKQK